MSPLTILLIIAAIACFVMWLLTMRKEKEDLDHREATPSLGELGPGGVISIEGADYMVHQKNRYSSGSSEWFEVKVTDDASEVWWLGWEEDDDTAVTLTQDIDFHALGLSAADLESLAEEGGELVHEGRAYHLDEAGDANYHKDCQPAGEPFYYWDFRDSDVDNTIGIECWDSNNYEASIGRYISVDNIEIYRAEGDDESL